MKSLLARLQHIFLVKFTMDVFARFGKDNGGLLSAGLAFFLVLAFVPLLLVGLFVLGRLYIHRPDEAVYQIQHLLQSQVLPGAAGTEVKHLMERAGIADAQGHAGATLLRVLRGHGIAGLFGILGVVWAAMQIFINGAVAMNAAWETQEKRSWIHLRLVALGLLVGVGVLLVASLVATAFSTAISNSQFARVIPFEGMLISALTELGAVVLSGLMYAVTYKYLPSAKVSWKAALVGGFAASIAWEVAKKGLSVWLLRPNKSLYGELGNLIVFILWIYYSMMILLLGAETSRVYTDEVEKRPLTRLKRVAHAPAAAATGSTTLPPDSPLARQKERNRAQRIRKTGQKAGQQAKR